MIWERRLRHQLGQGISLGDLYWHGGRSSDPSFLLGQRRLERGHLRLPTDRQTLVALISVSLMVHSVTVQRACLAMALTEMVLRRRMDP